MRNHFGLTFGTFASKALLLQAGVIVDLVRSSRVDSITTLRTGKEEVWNEIYFSRKENVACKFTFNVLLQIQERSSNLLRKYTVVHRPWQKDIACGGLHSRSR